MIISVRKGSTMMFSFLGCRKYDHFSSQGFRNDDQFSSLECHNYDPFSSQGFRNDV